MPAKKEFSKSDISAVKMMATMGYTIVDMAKELKVNRSVIYRLLNENNIELTMTSKNRQGKSYVWTDEKIEKLKQMYSSDEYDLKDIYEFFQTSESTISKKAKELGFRTLAICNVLGSTLTRTCDSTFFTHCGPEISVASTKAFTSQITSVYALALFLGKANGNLSQAAFDKAYKGLLALSKAMSEAVKLEYEVRHLTRKIYKADRFIFLGRNVNFPIALEGALKLKEVSYRSAEGFAAGEIKHGPISIIDKGTPVFMIMPHDSLFEKMLSACQECRARGAFVVAITTKNGAKQAKDVSDKVIIVPETDALLQPVLNVVPLQFLAYWIAKRLGCDIDQPRNLAKSVTVE